MNRRSVTHGLLALGALSASGCGNQRLKTDPAAPRCLRYTGFPETSDGWKLKTYGIPGVDVVEIVKLGSRAYNRQVLPNGDVVYSGEFGYGFYVQDFLTNHISHGTVTLRNPKNQDPHAAYAPLMAEGLAEPLRAGWVVADVEIPRRVSVASPQGYPVLVWRGQVAPSEIERIWVPKGRKGKVQSGKLTFDPVTYRIKPNLDSDQPSYLPQNMAERQQLLNDPKAWEDERGMVAFRHPDCR